MATQKQSDGIRKKGEPRPVRSDIRIGAGRHVGRRPISAEEKSPFLEHWRERETLDEWDPNASEDNSASPGDLEQYGSEQRPWSDRFRLPRVKIMRTSRARTASSSGSRMRYQGMVVGAVLLAALVIGISIASARLTVTVKPRMTDVTLQDVTAIFDTSAATVLSAQKTIPAELLSFSKKEAQSFPSTGKAHVVDRARGTVKIINRFSSAPQTLVASTRFLTDGGILFRLPKSVVVPGAKVEDGKIVPQSVEAELVADQPGAPSNISGETRLTIPGLKGTPKYDGFYAIASPGFSGGVVGDAAVISKDDIKNAQMQVTKAVSDILKSEMSSKIPSGFISAAGLQTVQIVKVDAPVAGAHADHFSVTASAVGKALIFREQDAVALVRAFVLADATGQEFVDGSAELQYQARSADFDKGKADMAIVGAVKTKAVVHTDELAVLVAGKQTGSIMDILRDRHELADFNLSFFPPWRSSAPTNLARIHVTVAGQ